MKKLILCTLLATVMAAAAAAADVTGKWSGSITLEGRDPAAAYVILKQTGATVTGTAGPSESDQWPNLKGTVKGQKILFDVTSSSNGTAYKCDMTLEGEKLTGTVLATSSTGQVHKATMQLTRIK